MDKRALLGKIMFVVLLVVVLLSIGTSFYLKVTKGNIKFSTGSMTINIDYNNSQKIDEISIVDIPQLNSTNQNESQQSLNKTLQEK